MYLGNPSSTSPEETANGVCTNLGMGRYFCNILTTHEMYGTTSSTGVVQFFDMEGINGEGTFVFNGGTGAYKDITGNVTSVFNETMTTHTVCCEGVDLDEYMNTDRTQDDCLQMQELYESPYDTEETLTFDEDLEQLRKANVRIHDCCDCCQCKLSHCSPTFS